MAQKQDATVNLARLLSNDPHAEGEVEAQGEFMPSPEWHSADYSIEQPLGYDIQVRAVGDYEFLLSGSVTGQAITPCRRCLKPVAVEGRSDFIYPMEYSRGVEELSIRRDEDDEEVLVFGQPQVDFAVLLAEVFSVDLPITAACADANECQDLVAAYGTDQDNDRGERSAFASLKDLDLGSQKE